MNAPSTAPDAGATARLLLVEDHAGVAEVTQEFLQGRGFEVRLVSSGREALAAAIAFQPDIVLCDLNLFDMAGIEVLSALRSSPAVARALLVIHSAASAPGCRIDVPEADLFLSKPLDNEKIAMLLAGLQQLREKNQSTT